MYHRYISDVSHIRSHHWKYWLDLYQNCGYNCSYCVYRIGSKMGRITPLIQSREALREALSTIENGIMYVGPKADIYQPRDGQLQLTRYAMEVLCDLKIPIFTVTRSMLILRDTDILQQMAADGNIEVSVTIASPQEINSIEPNTPTVRERLKLISQLKRAGITVSVHMSPIIPFLDTPEQLCGLMRDCRDSGADCIYACVLGLSDAYADHVDETVRAHHPALSLRDAYPEPRGGGAVYSASQDYIYSLMLKLTEFAEAQAIPFACVHLPELDTVERNGGIFRHKVPTVGDLARHFNRFGVMLITWEQLHLHLKKFSAVDDVIIAAIRKFWDEGVLFKNTHFHFMRNSSGEVLYERAGSIDLKISNMRVGAA